MNSQKSEIKIMQSNKPYLLRAFYQWIVDSKCVPVLVLDVNNLHGIIPKDYVEDGEIIFNISPDAVRNFNITNERIEFAAAFSGVIHLISVPVEAIRSVYAEENGEGVFFAADKINKGIAEVVPLEIK